MTEQEQELLRIKEVGINWNKEQRELNIMKGLLTAEDLIQELNKEGLK